MHCLRRSGAAALRRARLQSRSQPRRYAHDSHGAHHDHHAKPVNESFGNGFYYTLAAIPIGYAMYSYMTTGEKAWFTKVIETYTEHKDTWAYRNELHTRMVEQAAADRALFMNSPAGSHIELRFPETFNTGSPWNVPAGQGGINLDKVIAHYEKKNYEEQEAKLKALRDGTLKAEQPPNRDA